MRYLRISQIVLLACVGFIFLPTVPAAARDQIQELEALKKEMEELRRRDAENRRKIEQLLEKIERLEAREAKPTPKPAAALEEAVKEAEAGAVPEQPPRPALWSTQLGGGSTLRLIDISLGIMFAGGTSTVDDADIQLLEGGEHDPRQRGFTLQQVELGLTGAVDPYFTAEAYLVYFLDPEGESRFEIEEAFMTTQSLPYGLQLEAGQFFTEFGRINPRHPHDWDWQDQPFINTRFLGGDGIRQVGFRLGWLAPLPWFSELNVGVQQPRGETMVSFLANDEVFEERPIGGRPFVDVEIESLSDLVYLARWQNSWDLSPEVTTALGASGLFGPNATGNDGRTYIWGTDLVLKWRPTNHFRGWPFVKWQTEFMGRNYSADTFFDGTTFIPSETLKDYGFYSQLLYGFAYRWSAGIRGEYGTGSGPNVDDDGNFVSRQTDPFRSDRYRISPLLVYQPTEFSRIRLQYNYDNADFLEKGDAHSIWLGGEVFLGSHPAHKF